MASPAEPPFDVDVHRASQPFWRWAGPPGGQGAAWDTDARTEIRWRWGEVCGGFGLNRRILPDDGPRGIPHIGRITLGPPTRFTVRLRPGQSRRDIADLAPRLAMALEVEDVHVRDLAAGWVSVELVEQPTAARGPITLTVVDDMPADAPERIAPTSRPRSLRWWPHRRRSTAAETEAGGE